MGDIIIGEISLDKATGVIHVPMKIPKGYIQPHNVLLTASIPLDKSDYDRLRATLSGHTTDRHPVTLEKLDEE